MAVQQLGDKITPCLWFDTQGEDAARFYTSLFPNSKIVDVVYWPAGAEGPDGTVVADGTVLTVEFELDGRPYTALNGGPEFTFTEAVSFQISVDSQDELDELTERLIADGGEQGPCGWVKDKFGLSWQVVPVQMTKLLQGADAGRARRAMKAMMGMHKLDIAEIERAADAA